MTRKPNEKLRALFLTAIMVLSVFGTTVAFVGTTAAANATGGEALSAHTGPIEYATATGSSQFRIQVAFNSSDPANNPGHYNWSLQDRNNNWYNLTTHNTPDVSVVTNDLIEIDLNNAGINDLTGEATLWLNTTTSAGNDRNQSFSIQTTSTTVDLDNTNSDTAAYKGEWIAVLDQDAMSQNESYDLYSAGTYKATGSTGRLQVAAENTSTDDFTAGKNSRFEANDDGDDQNVSIRSLGLSVKPEKSSYSTTGGEVDIQFTISSNVAGRTVDATLYYAGNDTISHEKKGLTIGSNRKLTETFTGVNTGADYYILVHDVSTGIEDTTDDIPVEEVTGEADFANDGIFTEDRGDIVNITVTMSNVEEAQLYIGSTDINYGQGVDLTDTNEDGEVIVQWNTYTGEISAFNPSDRAASDEDTASTVTQANLNTANENIAAPFPVDAGSYDVNVSVGTDETGVGSVELTERSLDAGMTWVAPKNAKTGSVSQISKNSVQQSTTAIGDRIVLEWQASGFYGFLNDSYNFNKSSQAQSTPVSSRAQSKGLYLTIEQTNAGSNRATTVLNVSNVSVVRDKENNRFYTVIRTASGNGFDDASAGDKYKATLTLNESSPYVDADPDTAGIEKEEVSTRFSLVTREADVDNLNRSDELNVNPENVTLTGTASVAPGTNLSIRIKSQTTGQPYLLTQPKTTVQSDGTWSAEFDFSGRQDTEFTLKIREGSNTLRTRDGAVLPPPTASVTFNDQDSPQGASVIVASVTMSRGGFVAIHSGSAGGPVIGSSKFLPAGSHSNVRIALDEPISEDTTLVAMPHLDTDGDNVYEFPDADGPYTAQGAPVTDSASVAYTEETVRTVKAESPTPMIVTRTVKAESPTPREVERTVVVTKTATPGQPGFGVAIAVVALLAAALLALRRRD